MRTITLNKWQRLIAALGAVACLLQAYSLWFDAPDEWRPGLTFLGGIALAVLALSPVRKGEEALPLLRYVQAHRRQAIVALGFVTGGLLLLVLAPLLIVEETYEPATQTVTSAAAATELKYDDSRAADSASAAGDDPFPELAPYAEPRRIVPRSEIEPWLAEEMRKERDLNSRDEP